MSERAGTTVIDNTALACLLGAYFRESATRPIVPHDRDCGVFVRRVLCRMFTESVVDRVPVSWWHLYEGEDAYAPVLAAVRAGIGVLTEAPCEGKVHLVQGWRGTPFQSTGHTFLWWRAHVGTSGNSGCGGIIIQSSRSLGPRLDDRLWESVVKEYPNHRLAALRIE